MRNPEYLLTSLSSYNLQENYRYRKLYHMLYNPELYLMAYHNIKNNSDIFVEDANNLQESVVLSRIDRLIDSLRNESYHPAPLCSADIIGKSKHIDSIITRVPTFEDKLLLGVINMILEAIYEHRFDNASHGFRSNHSCHTALIQIQQEFSCAKWFIEGDIEDFYENMDHDVMIRILRERIEDEKFLRLIRKILNAGYLENWSFNRTYSGTPVGWFCSPILANIYLDRFDRFVSGYINDFERCCEKKVNSDNFSCAEKEAAMKIKADTDKTDRRKHVNREKKLKWKRNVYNSTDHKNPNCRCMKYVRYADDWIIGLTGSLEDCKKIKEDFHNFLSDELKLKLSDDKTLITNASDKAHFLGYEISVRKSNCFKTDDAEKTVGDYEGRISLEVPNSVIKDQLLKDRAIKIVIHHSTEIWRPMPIVRIKDCNDLEILDFFNNRICRLYNYYSIADNAANIRSYAYIMKNSMYKTFGAKYRTGKHEIIGKFRMGHDFGISSTTEEGRKDVLLFYNKGYRRLYSPMHAEVDEKPLPEIYS